MSEDKPDGMEVEVTELTDEASKEPLPEGSVVVVDDLSKAELDAAPGKIMKMERRSTAFAKRPDDIAELINHANEGKPVWVLMDSSTILGIAVVEANNMLNHKIIRLPNDVDARCYEKYKEAKQRPAAPPTPPKQPMHPKPNK